MKKLSAITLVLLLLAVLAVPAFAAENEFVPSIGYKDGPELDKAEMDEEDVTPCLVITSILQAKNKETDITQPERDLLLEIYEKLKANEMILPLEEDFVVRELIDISWRYSDCVEKDHRKDEWLSKPENTVTVTLKTGIPTDMDVVVLVYVDETWVEVTQVTRNPDKSLTCVFEEIGPVAICVREKDGAPPAQTGDAVGRILWLWILLLIASLGALTVLVLNRRKFMR